jgi:hypothetical protein
MKKTELLKRKAYLESIHDQLLSELLYIDHLMRLVGFTNGLATVKATAEDLIEEEEDGSSEEAA